MGERLTIEELRERYDGEWVVVADPETDDAHEVLSGILVAHDPDREEVYDAMLRANGRHFATLCFQKMPQGWTLAL